MSFPHLHENPGRGSYVSTALFNWALIAVIGFVFIPPLAKMLTKKEPEKISTEDSLIKSLNITVVNPTPENNNPLYSISTIKEPVVIITPTPVYETINFDYYKFRYSYYYPDLGGVNCHSDNWDDVTKKCRDVTASGKSWRQNMYRGIAIHYDLQMALPFGTIVEVIKPQEIRGFYEIIDICPGCTPRADSELYYIDFLDDKQRLNWGDIIELRVKK